MELSRQEINQLHDQIGIDPLPGDYPALDKLIEAFGYQTFYLTGDGLHIFEYTDTPVDGGHEAVSVRIASWADEEKNRPQPAQTQIDRNQNPFCRRPSSTIAPRRPSAKKAA